MVVRFEVVVNHSGSPFKLHRKLQVHSYHYKEIFKDVLPKSDGTD